MNFKLSALSLTAMLLAACSTNTHSSNIIDDPNVKAVGDVRWHLQEDVSGARLINKPIPQGDVSLFFIRLQDNDAEQTSANISVNDRFQVSLHPGNFTQVYSCPGNNRLSAVATGFKTNDLLLNTSTFNLAPNKNYFFYIDVDTQGNSTIQEITDNKALDYLEDKAYQTHQITRVVPNCPPSEPIAPIPMVIVTPLPPVIEQPVAKAAPVLEKTVSIELEVLFDNDKAIVKPAYYKEVEEVADFMNTYPNTTTTIEGHTDSNASESYNQRLSERRANAVKSVLVNRFGIAPERIQAIGYGELRPRADNATAEGRQMNRRVMAVIQERVVVPAQ